MARAAEASGFSSVWLGDHLLYRDDGHPERGPWDAWTMLAGLAAETEHVRLGPLVACLGFHPPGVLARMAASVNEIADGRLVLVKRAIEPGYGKWVFPGGYVDRGELLTSAAIREAREECGLDVRLDGLVNIYSYPGRAPVIVVYAATAIGGTICADEECLEAVEFETGAIPWNNLAFRSTEEGLQDYLAGLLHPVRS